MKRYHIILFILLCFGTIFTLRFTKKALTDWTGWKSSPRKVQKPFATGVELKLEPAVAAAASAQNSSESLWEIGGCDKPSSLVLCREHKTFLDAAQSRNRIDAELIATACFADKNDFVSPRSLLGRRHDRCAVVGSSGNILRYDYGAEIDAHDMVVRININPSKLKGYEKHVGSRLGDILFFGKSAIKMTNGGCLALDSDRPYLLLKFNDLNTYRKDFTSVYRDCWQRYKQKMLTITSGFRENADAIARDLRQKCGRKKTAASLTAGMRAIVFSMHICRSVTLYGFGLNEAVTFNFHRNVSSEDYTLKKTKHDFVTETRMLKYLTSHNSTAVSKFMLKGFDPPKIVARGASFDVPPFWLKPETKDCDI
eukprot:m.216870 g.216870  ORF g.216870 m.216870 type:complete len:368 (+) comp39878_c0_seq9:22-1125(+)